ncbi:ATPase [Macrococcoides caseolyticum subsp. caseolyticum]|uniref:ATPase n=1 Tax=Macrococcoides caseolyticum TaxID=69966 RepID=UPI000CD0560F|nr:ATPase [Macrococcus caseolyticus]PNZ72087.1 ATPase [Macrococcus caseolyticus]QPT45689.1 ATPase [Macrococcus caseolyticus]RAK47596.1 ATPase [Macrococcus caseolyticus subsp. caseolyticus]HCD19432.1 ATPase [Macrococcus caseolyticus]
MNLKLKQLIIKDFQGIKEHSFNFDGQNATIYGQNGSGKTTTATALQWLLFDKNLQGKQIDVVPLDKENNELYELIPHVTAVFDKDGQELKLTKESFPKYMKNKMTGAKEYTKSRTGKQYIDDVPFTITNFKKEISEIIDEDIFKLVTNIHTFNDLHWTDRRKILFEVCGQLKDEEIIESNKELEPLVEILKNKSVEDQKKVIKDKLKKTNDDIEDIPVRINEATLSKVEVTNTDINVDEVKQQIADFESQIHSINNGSEEIELRNQISQKKNELKLLEQNHSSDNQSNINNLKSKLSLEESNKLNFESKVRMINQSINDNKTNRELKLKEYKEVDAEIKEVEASEHVATVDDTCSCCGQALPLEKIESAKQKALEQFNKKKSSKLEQLNQRKQTLLEQGKQFKPTIEKLESDLQTEQKKVDDVQKVIDSLKSRIESLSNELIPVNETTEYKSILEEINQLNHQRSNIAEMNKEKVNAIREEIYKLDQKVLEFNKHQASIDNNKRIDERIKELRIQEEELISIKEELNYQLYLIDEFNRTKVKTIEESINNKFKMARFKLFDEKKNGNIEETCITTFEGIEFGRGLNTAAMINVGLDIINTLTAHYNVYAPIFIDNAESVTNVYQTNSQQIELKVSEGDKELRLSNES